MSEKHPVDSIAGDEAWSKGSTREEYIKAYNWLCGMGARPEDVLRFLRDIFWATAGEFGA